MDLTNSLHYISFTPNNYTSRSEFVVMAREVDPTTSDYMIYSGKGDTHLGPDSAFLGT